MQKAAFFDVDGTLTQTNVWRHLMNYFRVHQQHRFTHLVFSTLHYPLYFLRKLRLISESTFRTAWADHLAWYLRGYSEEDASQIWEWIIRDMDQNRVWREDVLAIFQSHIQMGHIVILVSSGPEPLIHAIGRHLGASYSVGTGLETRHGAFTGRSLMPICIDQYKAILAKACLYKREFQVDFQHSFSYSDSITDLQLLEMTGHPTAVYPDQELREIAQQRDWGIFPANP
jgi:HAD superfamily hydrolase (TIGR01490 family)